MKTLLLQIFPCKTGERGHLLVTLANYRPGDRTRGTTAWPFSLHIQVNGEHTERYRFLPKNSLLYYSSQRVELSLIKHWSIFRLVNLSGVHRIAQHGINAPPTEHNVLGSSCSRSWPVWSPHLADTLKSASSSVPHRLELGVTLMQRPTVGVLPGTTWWTPAPRSQAELSVYGLCSWLKSCRSRAAHFPSSVLSSGWGNVRGQRL